MPPSAATTSWNRTELLATGVPMENDAGVSKLRGPGESVKKNVSGPAEFTSKSVGLFGSTMNDWDIVVDAENVIRAVFSFRASGLFVANRSASAMPATRVT